MRIAGGVLLLLIGVFSLAEGGCVAIGCHAASKFTAALGDMGSALKNKTVTGDDLKKATAGSLADLEKQAKSLESAKYASYIIRLGGLLCLIAGIMFFVNKGKMFGFIAPAVGILGEILLFVLMAFSTIGLVKILIYAFGMLAATKVGQPRSA